MYEYSKGIILPRSRMNLDFSSIEKNADEALKTAIFSKPSMLVTSLKILMRTGKLDILSS